ncbi:Sister chromatid cohesion protein DCC1 [Cyanidiococcus yangmingshanensis]|uniref:Sister chromatid cohesion protein DCC1 n=1 Tax=Cyanidiococcus yangmingshanensis TaxID=2690220 RepID=A0A7J7IKL8_9RHOD|nr:Sister chromatid cohesion protein DCC1 [Cyanidiococcus yangmingshanensis]
MDQVEDESASKVQLFFENLGGTGEYLLLSLDKLLPDVSAVGSTLGSTDSVLQQLWDAGLLDGRMAFHGVLPREIEAMAAQQRSLFASVDGALGEHAHGHVLEQPTVDPHSLVDESEEHAVLCTVDATFSLWRQETSNSLLLFEPNLLGHPERRTDSIALRGVIQNILQCQRTSPSFKTLRHFMKAFALYGRDSHGLGWDKLLQLSAASEQELRHRLPELGIVFDASRSAYWMLDQQNREVALEHVLDTMLVHDLPIRDLSRAHLEEALLEMKIIDQVLVTFALEKWFAPYQASSEKLNLCVDAVVRDMAPLIIRQHDGALCTLDHLLECLQRRLPSSFPLDPDRVLQLLDGIAIIRTPERLNHARDRASAEHEQSAGTAERPEDKGRRPTSIRHATEGSTLIQLLEAEGLPREPEARLTLLFGIKKQWTRAELEPYIEDIPTSTVQRLVRPIRGPPGASDQLQRYEARAANGPWSARKVSASSTREDRMRAA